MNVARSASVFPSYSKLKRQLQDDRAQAYEKTIARLTQRLTAMQTQNDFAADHERIKDNIIALSAQSNADKPAVEKETLVWAHQRQLSGPGAQESLNYYIEDDKEEENNFETYLKFKKKALERDLEEDRCDRLSGKERRKQQQEEEHLFKNLYAQQRPHHTHAHPFPPTRPPTAPRSKAFLTPRRSEQEPGLADYREKMMYEKNKKFLAENYMDILKKLDSSNIVKWRILNDAH